MERPITDQRDAFWAQHDVQWRDPKQIVSQWEHATTTDPRLLASTVKGDWWDILAEHRLTLLITREYEHLVMALHVDAAKARVSYFRLPHPSGIAVNRESGATHIVSSRNPNQIYDFVPVKSIMKRLDVKHQFGSERPLVPLRCRFYPGCMYLHDLALIGGRLHANSVGQNAVVRIEGDDRAKPVWWPKSIETRSGPVLGQNYLQLNSIAAGKDLAGSYFSASAENISSRRPGHKNFPVKNRGVVFAGNTRQPVIRDLTRPHSARLHRRRLWLLNSGYAEFGYGDVGSGQFIRVTRLPGWTRGLCLHNDLAFVGTSRVIRRFRQYAPGVDIEGSRCGVHAVDLKTGQVLGSILWPYGNQIFSIDWIPNKRSCGFPFLVGARGTQVSQRELFYSFQI